SGDAIREGRIPDIVDGGPPALHCIVIVGYDPETKTFKFANSWGAEWGQRGFGYMTADVAQKIVMEDAIWAVQAATRSVAAHDDTSTPAVHSNSRFVVNPRSDGQYVKGRRVELEGSGLPPAATLELKVWRVALDGTTTEVPVSPTDMERSEDGGWRCQIEL